MMLMRLLVAFCLIGYLAGCFFLYRSGGWRWAGAFVLTTFIIVAVTLYSFAPMDQRITLAAFVRLFGGPLLSGVISGIPALGWFVVSWVHRRGTFGGSIYAVIYSLLIGLCFIPSGLVSAACYFPAVARKVLTKVSDVLPRDAKGPPGALGDR